MHLTNYAINKHSDNYLVCPQEGGCGGKWTLRQLRCVVLIFVFVCVLFCVRVLFRVCVLFLCVYCFVYVCVVLFVLFLVGGGYL